MWSGMDTEDALLRGRWRRGDQELGAARQETAAWPRLACSSSHGGQDELAVAGCGAKPEVNTDMRALGGHSTRREAPWTEHLGGKQPCSSMLTPASWGLRLPQTPPQPHRSPQGPGSWGGGNFEARGCSWKRQWSLKVAATGLSSARRWLNHRLTHQEAVLS